MGFTKDKAPNLPINKMLPKNGGFIKSVTKLMAGNMLAQVVAIVAVPVITRLFSAENYGIYAVILSSSLILTPLSTMCYHTAILMPKREIDSFSVALLSFISVGVFSLFLFVICINIRELVASLTGISLLNDLILLLPIIVFFHGIYLTMSFYQLRKKCYGRLSLARASETISEKGFVLSVGFLGWHSAIVLIFGKFISGSVASILLIISNNFVEEVRIVLKKIEQIDLLRALKKYRNFALFNMPSVLLMNGLLQLPTIIIAYFYSPLMAGLYAIGNNVIGMPANTLSDALSKTYLQYAAEHRENRQKLNDNSIELLNIIFPLLLIPFILLSVIGKEVFTVILGESWKDAGVFVQILALFVFSTFLARTFGSLFDILDKQHIRLYYHIINFIIRIGILIVGGFFTNAFLCVTIYSVTGTLFNLSVVIILLSFLDIPKIITLKIYGYHLAKSIPFAIGLFGAKTYLLDKNVFFVLTIVLIVAIWFVTVIIANSKLKSKALKTLSQAKLLILSHDET